MDDTKKVGRFTERALPNVAVQHRLNHVSYGNLGRLAYSPVATDEQSVGTLRTGRSMDLQENFQLLSRHREVLPPTRSAFPEVFLRRKPSEVAGCQKNWLLENHPEAVAGGGLDTRSLGVELKALKGIVARDVGSTTSSLLAVGEITDRTNLRSGTVGQPVIAMAAGEGGHILRIVRLSLDDAVWTEVDLSVRRSKVSTSARADWAEDGVPITLIKFATDGTRSHPTRWLLVQKMTGSTVLEPEVNVMPLQGGISDYKQSHLYYQMQRYISTNRLFTISAQKTGGGAQVDACFNPAADGRFPQLAIIDELGHWTVWDIPISRSAPTEAPRPILTARGVIGPSALPSLRTNLGRDLGTHRLVWVLPKGGRRAEQKDEYEGVEHAHWVPYSRSPVRCSHVLVCSDTDVWLYDVTHGAQLAGIRVVKVNRAESVVDMQSSPVSPSQAFVLTTSSLYWLESKIARDGQAQISVISSYPHYRRAQAEELILSVSPLAGLASPQSCAVFILSGKDKAADLLICTEPAPDGAAHTTQQVVRADIPPSTRAVFIASLPLRRYGEAGPSDAPALDNNDRRVFQMYALKSDLSLLSAMFVTSAKPLHDVVSLHTFNEADRSDTLRKQFLRLMGDAFVVPECFEDRLQTSLSVTERHGDEIGSKVKSSKKRDVIDLKAASGRLEELVIKEITPVKKSRQLLAGVIHHRGVEELGDNENMRIRTLSELVGDKLSACNLDTVEEEWIEFRQEVPAAYEGKVRVSDLGGLNLSRDLQSLTWQLSSLSYVDGDTPDSYKERQRHLLRHVSGKLYLSLFGISVAPPVTIPHTELDDAISQTPLPTLDDDSFLPSSPTLPGTRSRYSQEPTDINPDNLPTGMDQGPLSRLRRYVDIPTNVRTAPLSQPASTRLLSRWPATHTDPWAFVWEEDEGPLTAEDEEAILRRKRREEARRRRSVKQRLSLGLPVDDDNGAGPSMQPAFAATPRVALSSQPRVIETLSQSQTPARPRISMSQVMPGTHGGRPGTAKKKPRKSIFR